MHNGKIHLWVNILLIAGNKAFPFQDGLEMGLFHEELQNEAKTDRVPKMNIILQTARDIACGLDHVHRHHILHGDLTAGNVLLASLPAGAMHGARAFTAKVMSRFCVPPDASIFCTYSFQVVRMRAESLSARRPYVHTLRNTHSNGKNLGIKPKAASQLFVYIIVMAHCLFNSKYVLMKGQCSCLTLPSGTFQLL